MRRPDPSVVDPWLIRAWEEWRHSGGFQNRVWGWLAGWLAFKAGWEAHELARRKGE